MNSISVHPTNLLFTLIRTLVLLSLMQKYPMQKVSVQYHSGNITFCHLFSHAKLCRQESSEEQVGLAMLFFL